jgi:hypothetical protein
MPVKHRSTPRWLIAALAVPVIAAVYLGVAGRRTWLVGRGLLIGVLAATVIGSVYVESAARTAVVPARRQPLPLTLALALALALIGSGLPGAPVRAANADARAVVQAALDYVGAPYVWGATGPTTFDCSGLVYRVFKDTGELPLIGGRRLTARGYYKYFASRGLSSTTDGRPGDLVVYGKGAHIGIYLGQGKVVSALTNGVTVHGLDNLRVNKFTAFLHVPWGTVTATDTTTDQLTTTAFVNNVPTADKSNNGNGNGNATSGDRPTPDLGQGVIARGYAYGSLNVRQNAGPDEQIISWVTRGTTVDILQAGHSPGGALWYYVRKPNGREGWVWSGWMRVVAGSVDG